MKPLRANLWPERANGGRRMNRKMYGQIKVHPCTTGLRTYPLALRKKWKNQPIGNIWRGNENLVFRLFTDED